MEKYRIKHEEIYFEEEMIFKKSINDYKEIQQKNSKAKLNNLKYLKRQI